MSDLIPGICVAISTPIFPILEGEEDEIVNDRTYGKAVCQYLKRELPNAGISVPSFVAEDWGWWVSIEYDGYEMGLCVYSEPDVEGDPQAYAIMSSVIKKRSGWFRRVDNTKPVTVIMDSVEGVFKRDPGIDTVERLDNVPW